MEALFPLLLFAAVYFLMIRPQQQRVKRQREMVQSLAIGDEIVTVGGLLGTVVSLHDDRIGLRGADGVVIEALRGAVGQRLPGPADRDALIDSPPAVTNGDDSQAD